MRDTTKVFIGDIPAGTTEADLRTLIGSYVEILRLEMAGDHAFVILDPKDACLLIDSLNQVQWHGSRLVVSLAGQQYTRTRRNPGVTLFVGNLPTVTKQYELEELFEAAGEVTSVKVVDCAGSGHVAFVVMATAESAERAIEMFDRHRIGGRSIKVKVSTPKEKHHA